MNYYRCGGGSEKVTIDGVKVRDKMELASLNVDNLILNKNSRVRFYVNQVVVYNDVFYFLGENGLYKSKNGVEWELEAEYPLQTAYVGWKAVVYNDEIHFFLREYHYKWNGTTWTSVSTLPYNFTSSAVVFRNEIHILGGFWGGARYSHHYKWNGTTWTAAASLPYSDNVLAVVLNDRIHILGGSESEEYNQYTNCNKHFEYNGGSWTKLDDIVITVTSSQRIYISGVHGGSAFVHNNAIYVAGHSDTLGAIGNFLGYTCRLINAKVYHQ